MVLVYYSFVRYTINSNIHRCVHVRCLDNERNYFNLLYHSDEDKSILVEMSVICFIFMKTNKEYNCLQMCYMAHYRAQCTMCAYSS